MNFGRIDITPGKGAVAFRIRHEGLHREAVLSHGEVRDLIAYLAELLKAAPAPEMSVMAVDTLQQEDVFG